MNSCLSLLGILANTANVVCCMLPILILKNLVNITLMYFVHAFVLKIKIWKKETVSCSIPYMEGIEILVAIVWSLSCIWLFVTPWTVPSRLHCLCGSPGKKLREWAAISFSRRSSQPRDWTHVFWIGRWILYHGSTQKIGPCVMVVSLLSCVQLHVFWKWSHSVVFNSLQSHGLGKIHGISQARILGWVAISFSRGSSQHRDQTRVCCTAGRPFTVWATKGSQHQVLWCLLNGWMMRRWINISSSFCSARWFGVMRSNPDVSVWVLPLLYCQSQMAQASIQYQWKSSTLSLITSEDTHREVYILLGLSLCSLPPD